MTNVVIVGSPGNDLDDRGQDAISRVRVSVSVSGLRFCRRCAYTLKKCLAGVTGQCGSTDNQPGAVEREVVDGREVLRGFERADVAIEPVRRPQLALFLQLEDGCRCERLRQRCHLESSVRSVTNLPAPVCVAIRLEKLNGALPLHEDHPRESFGLEVAHDRLQPGWRVRRGLSDEGMSALRSTAHHRRLRISILRIEPILHGD